MLLLNLKFITQLCTKYQEITFHGKYRKLTKLHVTSQEQVIMMGLTREPQLVLHPNGAKHVCSYVNVHMQCTPWFNIKRYYIHRSFWFKIELFIKRWVSTTTCFLPHHEVIVHNYKTLFHMHNFQLRFPKNFFFSNSISSLTFFEQSSWNFQHMFWGLGSIWNRCYSRIRILIQTILYISIHRTYIQFLKQILILRRQFYQQYGNHSLPISN